MPQLLAGENILSLPLEILAHLLQAPTPGEEERAAWRPGGRADRVEQQMRGLGSRVPRARRGQQAVWPESMMGAGMWAGQRSLPEPF